MDVQSKISGLIQWKDHAPRAGETYCLKHLHPIELDHVMPAAKFHAAVTAKVHVSFGLHTFTRDIEAGDLPEDRYRDNRETRCFCHERYKHSIACRPSCVRCRRVESCTFRARAQA
jgi:hypothetical protein